MEKEKILIKDVEVGLLNFYQGNQRYGNKIAKVYKLVINIVDNKTLYINGEVKMYPDGSDFSEDNKVFSNGLERYEQRKYPFNFYFESIQDFIDAEIHAMDYSKFMLIKEEIDKRLLSISEIADIYKL